MALTIVAEVGSLTCGNVEAAKMAALAAKEAGADYVKFIAANPDELIADKSIKYDGQLLYDIIKSYQLSDDEWRSLVAYCNEIEMPWFVSVTIDYIPLMEELGCPIYKVGAWDCRNAYLIRELNKIGKPIFFDLGCVVVGEVENLLEQSKDCNTSLIYETHSTIPEEANLMSIEYMKDRWPEVTVGYSADGRSYQPDHVAVSMGAEIVEKRLTPFSDCSGHHQSKALNSKEFAEWVKRIRSDDKIIESSDTAYVGRYGLFPSMADVSQKNLWMTSLVFDRDMKAGEVVTRDDLAARRPGWGISPFYDYLWIGKELKKDGKRNQTLGFDHV